MDEKTNNKLLDFLDNIYQKVNYWLSFAEAKNAALIAFNIAMLSFSLNFSEYCIQLVALCSLLLIASTICCLISFYPNLKANVRLSSSTKSATNNNMKNTNLLFWKDIAQFESSAKYLEELQSQYNISPASDNDKKPAMDLANEILINSQIANQKYSLFRWALRIDLFTLILLAVLLVVA